MKKIVVIFIMALGTVLSTQAQDKMMKEAPVKTVALEQTPGEFTQKQLTLTAGTYIFEITNKNVGHDVGFVLVEKGKDISDPKNHIQTAYVTKAVAEGQTQSSKPTVLSSGSYYYFCPLNPTATDNVLMVK